MLSSVTDWPMTSPDAPRPMTVNVAGSIASPCRMRIGERQGNGARASINKEAHRSSIDLSSRIEMPVARPLDMRRKARAGLARHWRGFIFGNDPYRIASFGSLARCHQPDKRCHSERTEDEFLVHCGSLRQHLLSSG